MKSLAPLFAFTGLAAALAFPAVAQPDADRKGCTVVHIARDGTRTVTPPSEPRGQGRPGAASAGASSHADGNGPTSSRSSVAASASSHGRSTASASASSPGGGRRQTVTRTDDERGCTVTIDDR